MKESIVPTFDYRTINISATAPARIWMTLEDAISDTVAHAYSSRNNDSDIEYVRADLVLTEQSPL